MNTTVSFPGFGIEPFTMDKIAFVLFDKLEVRWYGVILTLGIVLAFLYTVWRGKKNEGIKSDDVLDIGLVTVVLGVIGARTYYVLTTLDVYEYKTFYDVIAIWNGGIAIYGSIIGGAIGILITCAVKKINWKQLFDMAAPGVALAQAVGRWGNFVNGEAYGYQIGETTRFFFLGQEYSVNSGEGTLFHLFRMGFGGNVYFHPTFLYESIWNLVGFLLLNLFYKHKKYNGQVALFYVMWYGLGRMFIEGFRTDSLFIPGTSLRISQCLALACVAVGLVIFLINLFPKKTVSPYVRVVESAPAEIIRKSPEEKAARQAEKEAADSALIDRMLARVTEKKERELTDTPEPAEESTTEETPVEETPAEENAAEETGENENGTEN